MTTSDPDAHHWSTRASRVVLAMALVTAVSGYFMGLRQVDRAHPALAAGIRGSSGAPAPAPTQGAGEAAFESAEVRPIVEYARLGEAGLKPNAQWRNSLATLRSGGRMSHALPTPGGSSPGGAGSSAGTPGTAVLEFTANSAPGPATDAERQRAVQQRAGRRAFDGAPPVVPHPIDAASSANCRVCHAQGLVVRDLVAPRMSHSEMGNCTQCHVPADGGIPSGAPKWASAAVGNDFVGRVSVGRGSRAWPGSPPTIPHTIWLRENCASCHGPTGLLGLRTTHPERALCTQCHVPEGGFEPGMAELADLSGPGPAGGLNSPP